MALRMKNRKKLGKASSMAIAGASMREMAEELGVSSTTIYKWKAAGLLDKPKLKKKKAKVRHETMEIPFSPETGTFTITGSATEIAKFLKAVQQ